MLLEGKNALITGCARGIGRATLEAFAANGANIYVHARQETPELTEHLQRLADLHRVELWPLCFDLTNFEAMKAAVKSILAAGRSIDVLVNNAGVIHNATFQMTTEKALRHQLEVNFFSPFLFTQYISKLMLRNKRGSIINIASIVGLDGHPGKSAYGASKAALIAMTKSIAAELGDFGIRANCIAPGVIETDMLAALPPHVMEETRIGADLRRLGLPAEIASAAVFLASDQSSYTTGQVIRVDGGLR